MSDAPRDRFLASMGAWHAVQPWARVSPRTLSIASVAAVGPLQIALRSRFESRGIRYQLRAAKTRTLEHVAGPDPWATALRLPSDARVGHEVTQALSIDEVPMDCGMCSAQGDLSCTRCGGTGSVGSGKRRDRCPTCRGAGRVRCDQCTGSGGVLGKPSVWARMDEHEALRTLGTDALPLEVVFDLSEHPSPGELLHRQAADQIHDVRGDAGYRGEPILTEDVRTAAEALLRDPGVAVGARVHHQELTVTRTTVLEATLTNGVALYAWGDDPVRVHPKPAATTMLGKLFFFLAR
ncbi:MAG: hypothetical protein J0L92_36180 [Deltaproteobacteria bacterium]|nr:hypothetical protein [Deltaproteobacteria bacterium]